MSFSVKDIFHQKMDEVQSRVPLRVGSRQSAIPFEEYLSSAAENSGVISDVIVTNTKKSSSSISDKPKPSTAIDKQGNNRSKDVQRAHNALSNSTAVIPKDKTELMKVINESILTASNKYGVDANLIRAIIKQESSYNPYSISHTGAQGLMQLMPGTADALKVDDPFDISQNIEGGTKYIRDQLAQFEGDMKLALAAYNAGPNAVKKYNGVPPYKETQDYVIKVMNYFKEYNGEK